MKPEDPRQLENPTLSVDNSAELACELAKQLEYKGEYEQARKVLSAYWPRIGEPPRTQELSPNMAAEVLLRAGVLTSNIGGKSQIPDAQETAKNLISESLTIFESLKDRQKIAEAQTELALCYWRTGERDEARDLLQDALVRLPKDSEVKAKAIIRLAIVERAPDKAVRILTNHAALFERIENHTLKGSYHVTLADRLENLGESQKRGDYIDRALIEYAAASYHFEQAEHKVYLANVENNLGFLYFKINRCDEAHEHLDHARHVYVSLKENVAIAQLDETRAGVFLKEGRVNEAEHAARSSVRGLEKSGRQALLSEALITHGRALARQGSHRASFAAFRRAIELAQHLGSEDAAREAALAAFQEIGDHLSVLENGKLGSGRAPNASGRGLTEEIRSFEHEVIKRALANAGGSVTHAARVLGMSYQALSYMLQTRHKDLLERRTPVKRRPRKQ
jgi:tetratricopeptide (TPR) repeat protein